MSSLLHKLTTLPTFSSPEENQLAQRLNNTLLLGIPISATFSLITIPFATNLSRTILSVITSGILIVLFFLLRRKKLKLVSITLVILVNSTLITSVALNGGLRDEANMVLIATLALTIFFLDQRATLIMGLIISAVFIGLYVAERQLWIPETEHLAPINLGELLIALIAVWVATIMLRHLMEQLISSNRQIKQQADALQEKNLTLQHTYSLLNDQTEHLTQLVAELQETQVTLISAKKDAEQSSRAKSDFLAKMSHDLRSPLANTIGIIEGLIEYPEFVEDRSTWLEHIQQNSYYLLELIDNLLNFSHISANKIDLRPAQFELLPFLTETAMIMQLKIEAKGLQFLTEFDEQLPVHWIADEQRLRQVLINLLENAAKFTEEGHVMLRVGLETAVSPCAKPTVRFSVIDTGIGIAAKDLASILVPFKQVNGHKRKSGVGLGLAICTQLIDIMSGELHIESQVGKGSCFRFDLPEPSHHIAASTETAH